MAQNASQPIFSKLIFYFFRGKSSTNIRPKESKRLKYENSPNLVTLVAKKSVLGSGVHVTITIFCDFSQKPML
jgi:hypothetical protein